MFVVVCTKEVRSTQREGGVAYVCGSMYKGSVVHIERVV